MTNLYNFINVNDLFKSHKNLKIKLKNTIIYLKVLKI